MQRVEELVKHTLSELLLTRVRDPRLDGVIVTHVKISKDLHHAVISVSCMHPTADIEGEILEGLERASGFLRRELAHRVDLKYTPDLKFIYDSSTAHAAHIQEILNEVLPEETPPPEDN